MTPLESDLFSGTYADEAVSALLSEQAFVDAMVRFEAALAEAQARAGVIPEAEATSLANALKHLHIPVAELREGTGAAGIPVPALVAAIRARLGDGAAYVHWGVTTHDVMDSATQGLAKGVVKRIADHLGPLCDRLERLADAHRHVPMLGRTWGQHAVPITFGLKAANWLDPVARSARALPAIRDACAVQLGGAAGTLSAMGGRGLATMEALAEILDLAPAAPWHASRDRNLALGGWCAGLCAALARIGADVIVLAASDVGEVRLGAAGGSSTMPQKRNPVAAHALVTLGRHAAADLASLHHAAIHPTERDPTAWALEWHALPRLLAAAGGAARVAREMLVTLEPDAARMRANLDAAPGALAEAASFALAETMPRAEAQALAKRAFAAPDPWAVLAEAAPRIDWAQVRDPANHVGEAAVIVERIVGR